MGIYELSQYNDGVRAGGPWFDSQQRQGFAFLYSFQTGSGAQCSPSLLYNGYLGALSLSVKRQGREADHSPPSSAKVKNGGAIPSLPCMSSWHDA
jgi:hypothetical protein